MTDEKSIRLSFGGFDCQVVGYDDPAEILRKAIGIYAEVAASAPSLEASGGPAPGAVRARFVEEIASRAGEFDAAVAIAGGRLTVTRRAAPADTSEPASAPAGVGRMEPGVLAEFEAMKARLRQEEAASEAGFAAATATGTEGAFAVSARAGAQPAEARAVSPQAESAETTRSVNVRAVYPAAAARARGAAAPRSANPAFRRNEEPRSPTGFLNDNFLFSDAGSAGAPPLTLSPNDQVRPAAAAPRAPEPDAEEAAPAARRFGFLQGAVPPGIAADDNDDAEAGDPPGFAEPGAPYDAEAGFQRLKESAEAALPRLDAPRRPAAEPRLSLVASATKPSGIKADGPEGFAAGAASLTRMVEAAAAWVALGEGRARFSRRDVMQALVRVPASREFTPEARLKAFRNLLKEGAIARGEDGLFALAAPVRVAFERRLSA